MNPREDTHLLEWQVFITAPGIAGYLLNLLPVCFLHTGTFKFRGFDMDFKHILEYSTALSQNNDRIWFKANHAQYETAKKEFAGFLDFLRFELAEKSPELAKDILYMNTSDWMYRTARDMRFYKDRPPYDPSFRAYICADKKSWLPIGYYIRIFPGETNFGTGLWCEDTKTLNRVRDYIIANFDEFERIRKEMNLPLSGTKLKKMPRGYSEDEPAAEWLKYKHLSVVVNFKDDDLGTFEQFRNTLGSFAERIEPMRLFLLDAAKTALAPADEDW